MSKESTSQEAPTSFRADRSFKALQLWATGTVQAGCNGLQALSSMGSSAASLDQAPMSRAWAALHLLPYLLDPNEVWCTAL